MHAKVFAQTASWNFASFVHPLGHGDNIVNVITGPELGEVSRATACCWGGLLWSDYCMPTLHLESKPSDRLLHITRLPIVSLHISAQDQAESQVLCTVGHDKASQCSESA
jgi:hypothetical protein